MTQDELDALLNGSIDVDIQESQEETKESDGLDIALEIEKADANYKIDPKSFWPPPPPSNSNKVVHQLDNVTKESEEKAVQLFDMLDAISVSASDVENELQKIKNSSESILGLLEKLKNRYSDISVFKKEFSNMQAILNSIELSIGKVQEISMNVLNAMDMMQYQDIHRQKIERVINVMRTLSNYMNKLFEGQIEDEKRVSSAKHIHGDENDTLVNDDDIEALIAAFGNKMK